MFREDSIVPVLFVPAENRKQRDAFPPSKSYHQIQQILMKLCNSRGIRGDKQESALQFRPHCDHLEDKQLKMSHTQLVINSFIKNSENIVLSRYLPVKSVQCFDTGAAPEIRSTSYSTRPRTRSYSGL